MCTESSQSWRQNDFEMSELLCVCNTLTLTSSSALLNNWYCSNISRLFRVMSHAQTPAVTQVWVTENDLSLWVTWQSTSCTMKLQLQEQNCDGDMCQHVHDEKKNYTAVVTSRLKALKVKVELNWATLIFCHLVLIRNIALLTKNRSLQTVCHRWSFHWVNIDSK